MSAMDGSEYLGGSDGNGNFEYRGPRKPSSVELRKKYPSLQDAWEKYQVVLELCRAEENSKNDKS